MKLFWLSLLITISHGFGALDPARLELAVSAVYVSKNITCTSPIQLFTKDYVLFYDALGFPVVGVSDNNNKALNGVYPCVIVKMKETLKFTPKSGSANCVNFANYESDICVTGMQNRQLDGSVTNCSTSTTGEIVFLYMSTGAGNYFPSQPFRPPTASGDNTNGVKIDTPFYVSGPSTGRFVVDGRALITGVSGTCQLPLPRFSFVNE